MFSHVFDYNSSAVLGAARRAIRRGGGDRSEAGLPLDMLRDYRDFEKLVNSGLQEKLGRACAERRRPGTHGSAPDEGSDGPGGSDGEDDGSGRSGAPGRSSAPGRSAKLSDYSRDSGKYRRREPEG